ncbi:hypothetical protein AJ79_06221 [Helicocarpus griseus UAMH5409]|uniref:Autophagy-related protein 2 n=1 Tax=Helicocarpus griseus UAMH5409 TaxID=1447875 RepID=A0A2B7XFK9_9EURO|nr:hypothetical protein AJ79_06221 [Helicocarpus griseus UAMH5409]
MSLFLPSFIQKRLLRYALSQLDLIDTDALDLDSLGITWGQRSTFDLRDINIRLEKLSSIVQLPPSCKLTKATASLVRVTIPADIYNSSIVIEVENVQVNLKLPSDEAPSNGDHETSAPTVGSSESSQAKQPSTSGLRSHGQAGEKGNILPSTKDLAQSFLESEPREEKAELEAAISSQSQCSHSSDGLSDDGEEELGIGVEGGVSLPSFVAGFLKGVVDRLQLKIKGVAFRVDMEVPHDRTSKSSEDLTPDPVTVMFTVQDVSVDSVASSKVKGIPGVKPGKRLISLSQINMSLLSDPGVFSNYSHFIPPPSPSTTHSKFGQTPPRIPSPAPPSSSDSSLAMSRGTILEQPSILEDRSPAPHLQDSSYSDDGRFSDAGTEYEYGARSYSQHDNRIFENPNDDTFYDHPSYLEEAMRSQLADDIENASPSISHSTGSINGPSGDTPRPQSPASSPDHMFHSIESSVASLVTSSRNAEEASDYEDRHEYLEPDYPHPETSTSGNIPHIEEPREYAPASPGVRSSKPTSDEDLSQSKIFTHEEASSMYMSVVSSASNNSEVFPDMPGGWASPKSKNNTRDTASPTPVPLASHVHIYPAGADGTPKARPLSGFEHDDEGSIASHTLGSPLLPTISQPNVDETEAGSSPFSEYSSNLSKRIIEVDKLSIWLPSLDKRSAEDQDTAELDSPRRSSDHMEVSTVSFADSVADDVPSTHYKARLSQRLRGDSTSSQQQPPESDSVPGTDKHTAKPRSDSVEVDISSINVEFDIACGWLATKMGQRLVSSWNPNGENDISQGRSGSMVPLPLDLTLGNCSFRFLEHVPAHQYATDTAAQSTSKDVILQAIISGLSFESLVQDDTSSHILRIAKFTFGHASEDIISFDEGLKMRDSVRDEVYSKKEDISLSVKSTKEFTRMDLVTLPVQFSLNLDRLDQTLSWFGGLSTILELGSSIASTPTVKGGGKAQPSRRPRGVHFAAAPSMAPPPTVRRVNSPEANPIPWKLNVRLQGFVMSLKGEQCSVKLKTTAVKIVSRAPGVTVQIDRAKLIGPILHYESPAGSSAVMNLSNIRVQYMFVPMEADLDDLVSLLTPSKDKYDQDDDIMLDTLLRQRKQGSLLRLTVGMLSADLPHPEMLRPLSHLGEEMARLSTVAKYLPQDDRPGILTLAFVKAAECRVALGGEVGDIALTSSGVEAAHVSIPSLMAGRVSTVTIERNDEEELIGEAMQHQEQTSHKSLPMIMARFIADEMDPTVKVKLCNVRFEYTVPSVIAFLGLNNDMSAEDFAVNIASSVVNLTEPKTYEGDTHGLTRSSVISESSRSSSLPSKLSVAMRDCLVGLNPRKSSAKGLVVFTYAKFLGSLDQDDTVNASLEIQKASIMIINDAQKIATDESSHRRTSSEAQSKQVQRLNNLGFVPVCDISSAAITAKVMQLDEKGEKSVDVEVRDDLLILETCADSTQTLITILNELAPPSPPNKALKYRTEVMPITDMLISFSGNAFDTPASGTEDTSELSTVGEDDQEFDLADELEYVSDFYPTSPRNRRDEGGENDAGRLLDSFSEAHISSSVSSLKFEEDHFAKRSAVGGTAHRWNSTTNTYALTNDSKLHSSPLRVRVRDVHFIWNLYDGYDWQETRDTISKAVKDVEARAAEKIARRGPRASPETDEEGDVVGDFLFNSIWIEIPSNRNPQQLREDINANINDLGSETGSFATSTTMTGGSSQTVRPPSRRHKRLRLERSRRQKMTFELKGISADLVVFPPGSGETQSSLDVRVNNLEIFDHIPSSNWKKFATYMSDAGERESGTSMVHLEILNVKPVAELAASEIVLKATVLPLRLHVDQDALDFLTRFFEFKDDSASVDTSPTELPFLQRVEVNAVPVKLDFKPKRVDYGGLRSGHTTEFMNFFILEEADMVLRHVIIYGISGFEKLGKTLNDIWMPDIKANQLPGILAGLAPIKSIVGVGSGFKDLVVVPMREYKKDGRLVRSIQKGAVAFAKTTTNELVKFGAKLAIGTQTVLQGAEEFLNAPGGPEAQRPPAQSDGDSGDEEQRRQYSPYADQPLGVVQGLRGAYSGLERDLLLARDAIVAVPGEVLDSGSAQGAAKALLKRAPTVILRPAIGASKALGKTLLGAGNSLDPANRRRIDDVSPLWLCASFWY